MNIYLLFFLSLITVFFVNLIRAKKFDIYLKKALIISVAEFVFGILGTQILFFVENGFWSGTSFFGAVLLLPFFMYPLNGALHIPHGKIMDYIAPSGLLMYAVNKINCYVAGCCAGRIVWYSEKGIPFYFPSQIVELLSVIIIVIILFFLENKKRLEKQLYPIGLIIYGTIRFILNFFREEFGVLPIIGSFGTLWSIISIIAGIVWFFTQKHKNDNLT